MNDPKLIKKGVHLIKKLRVTIVSALILAGLILWYSYVHIESAQKRGLASVQGAYGEGNSQKIKLIQSTFLEYLDGKWHLNIGVFQLTDKEVAEVCERYPFLQLDLRAVGVSTSGEVPTLILKRPCHLTAGSEVFDPLVLPVKELKNIEPEDFSLDFDNDMQVELVRSAGFWPEEWYIHEIRFQKKSDKVELSEGEYTDGDSFSVNSYEIQHVRGSDFIVHFDNATSNE